MATLTPEQQAWVERAASRVVLVARSVRRLLPEVSLDDLESAGYEGLVDAALRYDPASEASFVTFAHYRVRGAMIDWVRAQNPGLRSHQRAVRALQASQSLLENSAGSNVPDRRALEERVAAARAIVEKTATSVLTSRAMDNEPDDVASGDDPEQTVAQEQVRQRLATLLDGLRGEERELVEAIYRRGESMHDIADRLGVATSTVSRRHAKLMASLGASLSA